MYPAELSKASWLANAFELNSKADVRAEESRVTWRQAWKPDLKSSPWIPLPVSENQFWLKSHFQSDSMAISIFDGVHVWSESNTVEDVSAKTKLYNPNVEAPVSKVLQHLKECLQFNSTKGQLQVHPKDGDRKLLLEVTSNLRGGVPFKWKFETEKKTEETISEEITFPLLCMVSELIQREKALVSLLKRKDAEIDDMRAGGAKVSRKYLETVPFNHKGFQQERVQSKSFEELVKKRGQNCFDTEGQTLYKEVMVTSAWINRPQHENNFAAEGAAETLPVNSEYRGKESLRGPTRYLHLSCHRTPLPLLAHHQQDPGTLPQESLSLRAN
ncbi:putative non-homologous end-joining factor 1 [Apostichopus japonicus]|uniref:Non-homologous end-joining factor 1 n=1 Tax=Stichopus japonicus TaxID=307972 RepID=A0A2G8L5J8_STIJA|nr:putative non-homologous end-joining factor 1 [Apostichopus japonicus]